MFTVAPYHIQWHTYIHTQQVSSGRGIDPLQRPIPDNTQHSQQTYMYPAGFEPTIHASKQAAAALRLDRAVTGIRPLCYVSGRSGTILINWTMKCITSIYQPTNAHIISHKTILKHFKTLRHVLILSDRHQGALFLDKVILQYSQLNSYLQTRCCGSISCCVGMSHLATAPQHIPTQHDMLPQHLVCKYEFNCEYCNITLARNKAPWWWSDKIETCGSVLKCFKIVLCEIICAFVGW